jgi:hypothetical protein
MITVYTEPKAPDVMQFLEAFQPMAQHGSTPEATVKNGVWSFWQEGL